jgi:hypothetical protein
MDASGGNRDETPSGDRRAVLRAAGGLVLAASGLLLPADLEAKRGRGRKPGEKRERRDDRRDKREDRQDKAPGKSLLKDIMFTLSGEDTWWVVANGKTTPYVNPGEWKMANFEDDQGWLVLELGKDTWGRPKGYGIYVNNPLVGRVWFRTMYDVTVIGTTVTGGWEHVRRTETYDVPSYYEFTVGDNKFLKFRREGDTEFKNFRAFTTWH